VLFVEEAPGDEISECATVGSGVSGADFENVSVCELDAHDMMRVNRGVTREHDGHGNDGAVVHAVHEIADADFGDRTFARRSRDRRVRRRADGAASAPPLPKAAAANDVQIAVWTAGCAGRIAR